MAGSSPHTRGARAYDVLFSARFGIIPAYAGSTLGRDKHHQVVGGSSPHTRGAPCWITSVDYEYRIIPAYAGSTLRDP